MILRLDIGKDLLMFITEMGVNWWGRNRMPDIGVAWEGWTDNSQQWFSWNCDPALGWEGWTR